MPLDELTELGYEISRPPEGHEFMATIVNGHDRAWNVFPDLGNEEEIVQEAKNHAVLYEKLEQAQQYFSDNYKNWPTMTAQQKDAANRQAQRGLANLIRNVRNDLSSGGD